MKVNKEDGELVFILETCGQYVLELNGIHFALHIFFNPVRTYDSGEKEAATYSFGPGIHFEHKIMLKDNESLYVDENAIVFASVCAKRAKNIRIFGGGVIDGGCEERVTESYYRFGAIGNIRLFDCENVRIEDVILKDAAAYSCSFYDCRDVSVDNVKIVGQWRYNSDGIDPVNSCNVEIRNSFVRSFDDAVSIKALYGKDMTVEKIRVENCVLWCDWRSSLRVGPEVCVTEYRDILFRDCDVIHHGHIAMDIQNIYQSDLHDITFEDIRVEFQRDMLPCIYQSSDDMVYDPAGHEAGMYLIYSDNASSTVDDYQTSFVAYYRKNEKMTASDTHDITYKNIRVFLEEGMKYPIIHIVSRYENVVHRNFLIDGLFVNGEKQEDLSQFRVENRNVEPVEVR